MFNLFIRMTQSQYDNPGTYLILAVLCSILLLYYCCTLYTREYSRVVVRSRYSLPYAVPWSRLNKKQRQLNKNIYSNSPLLASKKTKCWQKIFKNLYKRRYNNVGNIFHILRENIYCIIYLPSVLVDLPNDGKSTRTELLNRILI